MKKLIFQITFLSVSTFAVAQDIHFTQLGNSPINLNPANTGGFDGDVRFILNHRSQWSSIPVPFKTSAFAVDIRNTYFAKNYISSVGIQVNADKEGDSEFGTRTVSIPLTHDYKIDSLTGFTFGVAPCIENTSFNLARLTFDNQYSGDAFDPAASSGENFARTSLTRMDATAGFIFNKGFSSRNGFSLGYAASNLLKPKAGFFSDNTIRSDVRNNFHVSSNFMITPRVDLKPGILFSKQGKFKETVLQLLAKYSLDPVNGYPVAVYMGSYYRLGDAAALSVGLDYYNVHTAISYDFNISSLNVATNSKGAFELSVIYILKRTVPFVVKKRVCPVYM